MYQKIILLFTFITVAVVSHGKTLTISTIENEPVSDICGLIMASVYKKAGHQIKIKSLSARRALSLSSTGKTDGELFRVKAVAEQYPELIRLSVPIYQIKPSVFTKNKQVKVNGWESLRSYSIGILRGVRYAEAATEKMNRHLSNSLDSMFKMLDADRFDIIVTSKLSGLITLRQINMTDRINILEPPVIQIPLYHFLHKKNQKLVPQLEKALKTMKGDGSLTRLIKQSEQKVIAKFSK